MRTLDIAAKSQQITEKSSADKFSAVQQEYKSKEHIAPKIKRLSPKISCTIDAEDKQDLDELTVFLTMQAKKVVNTSNVIRKLIRLGKKYKSELVSI